MDPSQFSLGPSRVLNLHLLSTSFQIPTEFWPKFYKEFVQTTDLMLVQVNLSIFLLCCVHLITSHNSVRYYPAGSSIPLPLSSCIPVVWLRTICIVISFIAYTPHQPGKGHIWRLAEPNIYNIFLRIKRPKAKLK